jgi:hypothetical protein
MLVAALVQAFNQVDTARQGKLYGGCLWPGNTEPAGLLESQHPIALHVLAVLTLADSWVPANATWLCLQRTSYQRSWLQWQVA